MRILFIGDIVGKPGHKAVSENVAAIRQEYKLDYERYTGGLDDGSVLRVSFQERDILSGSLLCRSIFI